LKSVRTKKTALLLLCLIFSCLFAGSALANTIIGKGYHDGLIRYQNSKMKVGYMNMDGEIVIKADKFTSGQDFSNGLAVVQYSSGGFARNQYIDTNGKVAIKNIDTNDKYYGFRPWQGDYAIVEVWKIKRKPSLSISKMGINYINASGKLISKEDFMYAGPFSEGYALVGSGLLPYGNTSFVSGTEAMGPTLAISSFSGNTPRYAANKYYYIDMNGKQLGSLIWDAGRAFCNGFAAVAAKGADGSFVWGFIDHQGEMVVSPQWASVSNFTNGMASVFDGEKYGFVNTSGDLAIPCTYDQVSNFSADGIAAVKVGYNWGYINASGETVLEPEFSFAGDFVNGTAIVENGVGIGMIDTAGAFVIPPVYESVNRIGSTGRFIAKEFSKAMIVNEKEEIVSVLLIDGAEPTPEQLAAYPDGKPLTMIEAPMSNGMTIGMIYDENGTKVSMNVAARLAGNEFFVRHGTGRMVLLNASGEIVGKEKWDGFGVFSEHVIAVLKNNLFGFIDMDGNVVRKPQYTSVTPFDNGAAVAYIGSNAVSIDDHARELLPEIKRNSGKEDIKKLQQSLIDLGYLSGKADGAFGEKTTKAIKAAQERFGMAVTGKADSAFQYMLFSADAVKAEASAAVQASATTETTGTAETAAGSNQTDAGDSASSYKILKPGSKGQAVLNARMKLYELGYFRNKPTQTEYTNNMKDYVRKFEKDNGLEQDGILSPEDQEILFGL